MTGLITPSLDTDYSIMNFLPYPDLGRLRLTSRSFNTIILKYEDKSSSEITSYKITVLAYQQLKTMHPEAPLSGVEFTLLKIKLLFGGFIDSGKVTLYADQCPNISHYIDPTYPYPKIDEEFTLNFERALDNNVVLRGTFQGAPVFFARRPKQIEEQDETPSLSLHYVSTEAKWYVSSSFPRLTHPNASIISNGEINPEISFPFSSSDLSTLRRLENASSYRIWQMLSFLPCKLINDSPFRLIAYREWEIVKGALFALRKERAEQGIPSLEA